MISYYILVLFVLFVHGDVQQTTPEQPISASSKTEDTDKNFNQFYDKSSERNLTEVTVRNNNERSYDDFNSAELPPSSQTRECGQSYPLVDVLHQTTNHFNQQPNNNFPTDYPTYPGMNKPTYPVMDKPIYPGTDKPIYPGMDKPIYPGMDKPSYPIIDYPTYPVDQNAAHPVDHNPVYPVVDYPNYPIEHNPSYPVEHNPTYPLHENPTYPLQQNPTYPLQQNPTYPGIDNPTSPAVDNSIIPKLVPYLASLHDRQGFICPSTLFTAQYSITAAHCVIGRRASDLSLRVGSAYLKKGGETYRVSHVAINPDYNIKTNENDIAVIRIIVPTKFEMGVRNLQLPSPNYPEPAANSLVVATGFAFVQNELRELQVNLRIVDRARCRKRAMSSFNPITEKQICASSSPTTPKTPGGGSNSCFGNAGGPIVVNDVLIGVWSWATPSCTLRDPDVYTNVKMFVPWIYHVMKAISERSLMGSDGTN